MHSCEHVQYTRNQLLDVVKFFITTLMITMCDNLYHLLTLQKFNISAIITVAELGKIFLP